MASDVCTNELARESIRRMAFGEETPGAAPKKGKSIDAPPSKSNADVDGGLQSSAPSRASVSFQRQGSAAVAVPAAAAAAKSADISARSPTVAGSVSAVTSLGSRESKRSGVKASSMSMVSGGIEHDVHTQEASLQAAETGLALTEEAKVGTRGDSGGETSSSADNGDMLSPEEALMLPKVRARRVAARCELEHALVTSVLHIIPRQATQRVVGTVI